MSFETCPTCRTTLRYPTDALGRLYGYCTTCETRSGRSTVTVTPRARTAPLRRTIATDRVQSVLATTPSPLTMAQIIDRAGLGTAGIREAVRRLRVAGLVRTVPFGQGKSFVLYYESTVQPKGIAC